MHIKLGVKVQRGRMFPKFLKRSNEVLPPPPERKPLASPLDTDMEDSGAVMNQA